MPRTPRAAIPPAPRKTLLQWIELDGDPSGTTKPICSADVQALHAHVIAAANKCRTDYFEPLQPPPGLHLAPLG